MIIDFILNLVYNLIVWFLALFPEVSLSDSISSSIMTASGYLSALNTIAPVSTLLAIIGLFLTIEGVILIIKIINWFIRKIPTID
jgi:hypothetical protein